MTKRIGEPRTDFDGSETSLRDERNPRLRSVSDSEAKVQTDCTGARQRRAGNSRLRVLPSTIEGAGNGLLARTMIKAKEQICDYRGETVSQEDIEREDLDNTYVFSWPVGDTWRQTGARLRTAHDDRQGQEDCRGRRDQFLVHSLREMLQESEWGVSEGGFGKSSK